jgi:hypothetical protein
VNLGLDAATRQSEQDPARLCAAGRGIEAVDVLGRHGHQHAGRQPRCLVGRSLAGQRARGQADVAADVPAQPAAGIGAHHPPGKQPAAVAPGVELTDRDQFVVDPVRAKRALHQFEHRLL